MKKRTASLKRKTKETDIKIELNLDGSGKYKIDTGIAFLDHMLELLTFHSRFDLKISAVGDYDVDIHHTNEDIGLALGEAFSKALGDKKGIRRFGNFYAPMGEALTRVVLDISGRPSLDIKSSVKIKSIDGYQNMDLKHFLESFTQKSGMNLHIDILKGEDTHHILESVFKSLAKALSEAVGVGSQPERIPSTKGKL
ncbi:MAG: imidazoleglycerol-phosphate dehydratase HisB [Candidatus Omnitrophica bacterium]|nr:imidazoleglycerol-phosphate dehydratase HisB [Candidatus Omnitrophota bacterium]